MEIRKDEAGSYRFVVMSQEGHDLLESIPFARRSEAEHAAGQLQAVVQNPACFERKTDHLGRFHFTLRAADRRQIANSKFYRSEAGMENGIKNTLRGIAGAGLE